MRQPTWSPRLIATTTSRRFLLAYTGSSMPVNYLQDGSACVEVPTWCSPRYLADLCVPAHSMRDCQQLCSTASWTLLVLHTRTSTGQCSFTVDGPQTWNSLPAELRTPSVLLQASFQGPPVSAVVCAAAGSWAQHRSSGAVVTVQRIWRRLWIFRLTYLLTKDDGGGDDNWSYKTCKAPVKMVTNNKPTHNFHRPHALTVVQPTVSEHWRENVSHSTDMLIPSSPRVIQPCLWPLKAPAYVGGELPRLSSSRRHQYPQRLC